MFQATRPEVSVVIPAYNEENRIRGVITKYSDFHPSYEIIVVCNGCTDATVPIVEEIARSDFRIKLMVFEEKLGKGGAIMKGFKSASGNYLGFLDSDEAVGPEDYLKLIDAVKNKGFDGAIGSRRIEGAKIISDRSLPRRFASTVFNKLARGITGLEFNDTQCGAKIFRRNPLNEVRGDIYSVGYEFDVELLLRLKKRGYKIVEVPVKWKHGGGSKFSLMHAPSMFVGLLLIRLKMP